MRRGALLNDAQLSGMLPTSVGGGENAAGNWSLMAGFCGPGSVMLLGFLALIAPCGGSFGLPKAISLFTGVAFAVVMVAAVATPPTAVAANMSRLDIMLSLLSCGRAEPHCLLPHGIRGTHHRLLARLRRPFIRQAEQPARLAPLASSFPGTSRSAAGRGRCRPPASCRASGSATARGRRQWRSRAAGES